MALIIDRQTKKKEKNMKASIGWQDIYDTQILQYGST